MVEHNDGTMSVTDEELVEIIGKRFERVEARLAALDARADAIEARLSFEARLAALEARL